MRIDHLIIKNFKGFKHSEFSFHPRFNLIVGDNATGKTSLLDALSIASGSWLLGFRGYDSRPIRAHEVLLMRLNGRSQVSWEYQYPCSIEAAGGIQGQSISWVRSRNTSAGRTTYREAGHIKMLAEIADHAVRSGEEIILPLIAYYGTGRLWNIPREQTRIKNEKAVTRKENFSRLAAYRNSLDPRLSAAELIRWIARQSWIAFQQGGHASLFGSVQDALIRCIEGAEELYFDAALGEVIVKISQQVPQPFNNLSDGQRCMLAMVGDIAQKAAALNPYLGSSVLEETPGIVLIDELDLHLHPKWQQRVVADLSQTFPKIQFFATTHSPRLVGQTPTEQIMLLDGKGSRHPGQSYGMDSNWILRHIMDTEDRDPEIDSRIDDIFKAIEESQFGEASESIASLRAEIGEHPDLTEAESLISHYTRFEDEET
jgi:predicted ATP-binding protein involved in virulence